MMSRPCHLAALHHLAKKTPESGFLWFLQTKTQSNNGVHFFIHHFLAAEKLYCLKCETGQVIQALPCLTSLHCTLHSNGWTL